MTKVFACPQCRRDNVLPDDCKEGDEHKCRFCGKRVRLRYYIGCRIPVDEG